MIIIASSDGYVFGKLGCAKIIPQKTPLCAAWPINFLYQVDSYLQSRFLHPGRFLGYNLFIASKQGNENG
jgi:hypothetical protein